MDFPADKVRGAGIVRTIEQGCHDKNETCMVFLPIGVLEQVPQRRNIAENRDLGAVLRADLLVKSANQKRVSVRKPLATVVTEDSLTRG